MKKTSLTLLFLLFSFCIWAGSEDGQWFESSHSPKKGQSLVIHGLNTNPDKMSEIVRELTERGHDVLLLRLKGHNKDLEEMKVVTAVTWREQVEGAFKELALKHAAQGGIRSFVGYSLGAVLGASYLSQFPAHKMDRVIYFSPAFKVKFTSKLIKAAYILGNQFVLPSLSADDYKAQKGTSVAAYKALFDSITLFQELSHQGINVPTVVFMDPEDEMVSYSGVKELVATLNEWKLVEVSTKRSQFRKPFHHLIITPEALGESEWKEKMTPEFNRLLGDSL